MTQVYIKYNPYRLKTLIKVNGREIEKDSTLAKIIKGKRLQEWIGEFPKILVDELNAVDFSIEFYGMALDWDDFEESFKNAKDIGIIRELDLKFIEGKSDEDINEKIVEIFTDLQKGPIKDFREKRLCKAFENINNSVFPINVIATMSSGKSTLINALLNKKLMPSKNEACTAIITEILDNDEQQFEAIAYNINGEEVEVVPNLTYEVMDKLNSDKNVHKISATGDIPFLDSRSTALMLVDTPGPNNSQNQEHKNTTYRAINNDSNNLILYVLNGTQLSTNDDASLLGYIAEQIKKGGKQIRDRFLFVINKMDSYNPEDEDIVKVIKSAKRYLSNYGIEEPQIFPCSAYTALNIRTYLNDVDIDNISRADEKKLPSAARDTLTAIDKFNDYEQMHLEKYSTLSPSAKRELDYRLRLAKESGNTKEQALIHCGIYSIEEAIKAYVKKYAKTKKIKDLVESFQEVLESNQVLTKAKTQVATDEKAAQKCAERAAIVKAKIAKGKEATQFKERVKALEPMTTIRKEADKLRIEALKDIAVVFGNYNQYITNDAEVKRLVEQFAKASSRSIAKLVANLESIINKEIVETGNKILFEYQQKLLKIDEEAINKKSSADSKLDFSTVDLIKGSLTNMKKSFETWTESDNNDSDIATKIAEEVGEVTEEKITYWEKGKPVAEQVYIGSHKEKVGTRRVMTGSHKEKTGTRRVKNPKKTGLFDWLKFWEPNYIEENVYEIVNDYEDEDVYETVADYKTVMRDRFEKKEKIERKYRAEIRKIKDRLSTKLTQNLVQGIDGALYHAENQIENMKSQFMKMFDELDKLIQEKYDELQESSSDQETKEKKLEEDRQILKWIEKCQSEIDEILDM